MAEIRPVGIDQTTGQQRSIIDGDTVANNIGSSTFLNVSNIGDYNSFGNLVNPAFSYGNPIITDSPATTPSNTGRAVKWSPGGEFLAVGNNTVSAGEFHIYQRTGRTLTRLPNPSTVPVQLCRSVSWSGNGEYLAASDGAGSGGLFIYQRSGTTFTALAEPASAVNGISTSVSISPNGEFVATGFASSPYLTLHSINGTTLTFVDNPATLPTAEVIECSWSNDSQFLGVSQVLSGTRTFNLYQRSGSSFERLSDPTSLPAATSRAIAWSPGDQYMVLSHTNSAIVYDHDGNGGLTYLTSLSALGAIPGGSWHPSGNFIALGHLGTPYVTVFRRSGDTFTDLELPASLPNQGFEVDFSPDGQFLAAVHANSPYLTVFQTTKTLNTGIVVKDSK